MIVFGFAAESLFRNLTLLVEKLRGSYEKKRRASMSDIENLHGTIGVWQLRTRSLS